MWIVRASGLGLVGLVVCLSEFQPTGREPLNNQPYFRIQRVTPEEILPLVHQNAKKSVEILISILNELEKVAGEKDRLDALASFIFVRRSYQPNYGKLRLSKDGVSFDDFRSLVADFVADDSEGGKRAQAVAAGLMDMFVARRARRLAPRSEASGSRRAGRAMSARDAAARSRRVVQRTDKRQSGACPPGRLVAVLSCVRVCRNVRTPLCRSPCHPRRNACRCRRGRRRANRTCPRDSSPMRTAPLSLLCHR